MTEKNLFQYISKDKFLKKYATLHDSIFSFREYGHPSRGRCLPQLPFVKKKWEAVLLPYGELMFEDIDFTALTYSAQTVGDRELIIIIAEKDRDAIYDGKPIIGEQGVCLHWDQESIMQVRDDSDASFLNSHLFGLSGTWGIVSYDDYCFCVGGNKKFMELFTQKAGGRVAIKERFFEFNRDIPEMIDDELREEIYTSVGWNER